MRITLLYEPSAERKIPFAAGAERYHRFADELGRYAGIRVPVVEDSLRNAPTDAYILFAASGDLSRSLSACSPIQAAELPSRIVLLDIGWQQTLQELEQHRLAGAVDSLRMSEWLARPTSCKGPFGLKYFAKALGVNCSTLPWFQSKHYCRLDSNRHRGLPHLMADYLAAYDRDRTPLHELPSLALARLRVFIDESGDRPPKRGECSEQLASISLAERVNTKRVVASLKQVRQQEGLTLPNVAESVGLDPDQLSLLEQGDLRRTTLGMLRGYVLALAPRLQWTLVDSPESPSSVQRKTVDPIEKGETSDWQNMVSPAREVTTTSDASDWQELPAFSPELFSEGGMTVLAHFRIRRRQLQGELDNPTSWSPMGEPYAGV
jgi:hypothetical protein